MSEDAAIVSTTSMTPAMPATEHDRTLWDLAPESIQTEALRLIYQEVVGQLRADAQARGGMKIDDLLMERIAFVYVFIRDKEMQGELGDWREYRDMNRLLIEMITAYSKSIGSVDAAEMRDSILKRVLAAINSVLRDLSPELETELRTRFTDSFRNLDI